MYPFQFDSTRPVMPTAKILSCSWKSSSKHY